MVRLPSSEFMSPELRGWSGPEAPHWEHLSQEVQAALWKGGRARGC